VRRQGLGCGCVRIVRDCGCVEVCEWACLSETARLGVWLRPICPRCD